MKRLLELAFAFTLMAGMGTVAAMPLVTGVDRSVSVGSAQMGTTYGPSSPSPAGGLFDDLVSLNQPGPGAPIATDAQQTTTVDAAGGQFFGSGHVFVGYNSTGFDDAFADSFFDVFFDLDTDYNFLLSFNLAAAPDGGLAQSSINLTDLGGPVSVITTWPANGSTAGTLSSGSYRLTVEAKMGRDPRAALGDFYGGDASFDFRMALSPAGIPEPATVLLLAAGIAGMGLSYRLNRSR